METILGCPICTKRDFSIFLKCKDYSISHETFYLVKCNSCNFIFINPRPDQQEIIKYYQSVNYISHSNSSKGLLNFIYQQVRKFAIKGKVNLIQSLNCSQQTILDYGSGTGEFLNAMKYAGWKCRGIEPSYDARIMAISRYSLKVDEPSSLSEITDEHFGVITLWHVLEHIHKLKETIKNLNHSLIADGFIIVAVPNHESLDAKYYQEFWAAYDVPRHLYHFTKKDITTLFKNLGFQLKDIRPMFYDPFYISLLSEKYKNGKTNYFNAVINGIKTTVAGQKDITKNTSLIYIFQKSMI